MRQPTIYIKDDKLGELWPDNGFKGLVIEETADKITIINKWFGEMDIPKSDIDFIIN
jgi:RNase P/RNase MRP subunit p29